MQPFDMSIGPLISVSHVKAQATRCFVSARIALNFQREHRISENRCTVLHPAADVIENTMWSAEDPAPHSSGQEFFVICKQVSAVVKKNVETCSSSQTQ